MHFKAENFGIQKHPQLLSLAQNLCYGPPKQRFIVSGTPCIPLFQLLQCFWLGIYNKGFYHQHFCVFFCFDNLNC